MLSHRIELSKANYKAIAELRKTNQLKHNNEVITCLLAVRSEYWSMQEQFKKLSEHPLVEPIFRELQAEWEQEKENAKKQSMSGVNGN